jgi:hypothetical protein
LGDCPDADRSALAAELPPGTQVHHDLNAFADWLLAQETVDAPAPNATPAPTP